MISRPSSSVLRTLYCIFIVFLLSNPTKSALAQSQTVNPGGGVRYDYSDGIKLTVGHIGDFQMFINNTGQLYNSSLTPPYMGTSSVSLRIDGAAGTRIYERGVFNNHHTMDTVSQSIVTGNGTTGNPWQIVTVIMPNQALDSAVRITLTDRYVFPSLRFSRKIEVTGLNPLDTARLYWYFDTQTGGSAGDSGVGYLGPGNIIGTRNPITLEKLQFEYNATLGPLWNHYHSGQYQLPESMIAGSGDFEDIITPAAVDAGLGLQWNIPPASTSFTSGSDLVYLPAGIFARESYAPETISIDQTARMTISLSNANTVNSTAAFSYSLPSGLSVASPPNLIHTCTPGGGTVTASGNNITVSNLALNAEPGDSAYTCSISLDLISQMPGNFIPSFISPDESVGHSESNSPALIVTPPVYSTAQTIPSSIARGDTTTLAIELFNRDISGPQNDHDLTFDTYSPDVVLTTPQQVTTSCPHQPLITVSGSQVKLTQIDLPQATSENQPYSCSVTLQITAQQVGTYPIYFTSSSGMGTPDPSPYLEVLPGAIASAYFEPKFLGPDANTARFTVTINNAGASPRNNLNFTYTFSPDLTVSSQPDLTNTCFNATTDLTSSSLTVSGLNLPGNTNYSESCQISFNTTVNAGTYNYGFFNSPDGSVFGISFLDLYASDMPTGANLSSVLSPQVIGGNQTAEVRITISTFENAPLSGLGFGYSFDPFVGLTAVPDSVTSTCPGNPTFTLTPLQGLSVTNLSLNAAPTNGRYDCAISFRVKETQPYPGPRQFVIQSYYISGPFNILSFPYHYLLTSPDFISASPPIPSHITAVPGTSVWSLITMVTGLLLIAGTWMSKHRFH